MLDHEIVKLLMRRTKYSQEDLSKETGFGSQMNISSLLKAKSLRVAVFVKMCNVMGYDVFVRKHNSPMEEELLVTYSEESLRSKRANLGNVHQKQRC